MNFRVTSDLTYNLNGPTTFLFALKCIQTGGQQILVEDPSGNPIELFQPA